MAKKKPTHWPKHGYLDEDAKGIVEYWLQKQNRPAPKKEE